MVERNLVSMRPANAVINLPTLPNENSFSDVLIADGIFGGLCQPKADVTQREVSIAHR